MNREIPELNGNYDRGDMSKARNYNRPPSAGSNMSAWEKSMDLGFEQDEPAAMEGEQYGKGNELKDVKEDGSDKETEEPNGCWWNFKRLIRSCWATRYTEDTKQNRELYIKTTVRELVTYILFLVILIIIAFSMINQLRFYYTRVIKTLFLNQPFIDSQTNFLSVTNIADFWKYLYGPLLNGLYWDRWYNGDKLAKENELIYYENKLLGVPRIRQLRIKNDSCEIPKDFQNEIKGCYAEFTSKYESTDAFGLKTATAWVFTPPEQMNSSSVMNLLGEFHSGGFYKDLYHMKNDTLKTFDELFNYKWIDKHTRVAFVDFTLYNANINLFSVIRLIFNFPATGGVTTESDIRVVKLMRYVTGYDYFVGFCELLFLLFIGYYIIEETLEIKKHRFAYFTEFWNWLDILVIIISVICAGFNIYRTAVVGKLLENLVSDMNVFPQDFDFLSFCQQHFNNAIAVTLFIAWVKIFKYISFNKTMTQLSSTLGRCSKDLAGFAVMFFIVFFAFAQLGYFIFGSQLKDFKSLYDAGITQFRIVLGDFDYQQLESVHRILGPTYFILFVFFVFFVLINMFLAIINDTYGEVKAELATQKNEFEMADYFKNRAKLVLDKFLMKQQKIKDIQQAIKSADINNDMEVDFDEWRNELKNRGYAEGEIEAVFAKYDADGDRVLNTLEQKQMQEDLKMERANIENRIHQTDPDGDGIPGTQRNGSSSNFGIGNEEFTSLKVRVNNMEESIGLIMNKLDNLLDNFSKMDQMKLDQSRVVFNLLETLSSTEDLNEAERKEKLNNLINRELEKYDAKDSISQRSFDVQSRPSTARSNRSLFTKNN